MRILVALVLWVNVFVPSSLYSQDNKTRNVFAQAYALFSQGGLSQAEESFIQTLDRDFALEDYSLYFLALIRMARVDPVNGRNYLSQLKEKFPQSIWIPQADLQLAKISLGEKNYQRAIGELQALQALTSKKDIADQASFLLGQAYEMQGDLNKAYAAYQDLRQTSPTSRWAAQARSQIRKMREQRPESFTPVDLEALAAEAELLLREREHDEAAKMFRKLLERAPEEKQRPRFLLGLANVYRAQRKRDEAISVLGEIVSRYPDSADASNALYRLAVAHWNRDDNLQALEYFNQLKERYPKSAYMDFSYFASARIYESLGKLHDAVDAYREFPKRFPHSKWLTEALWRRAWIHYMHADYTAAHSLFRLLTALPLAENYKNSALYWQGRTALKLERPQEAKRLFLQISNGKEDTYYRGPAEKGLAELGAAGEARKPLRSVSLPEPAAPLQPSFSFHLTRAQELAQIPLNQLAITELDELQSLARADVSLNLILMREYARNRAYSRIVGLSSKIDWASEELDRYRYPLAYWETIQKLAAQKGIDPYLVVALIRQESLFDPRALSSASAHGLMQLLPATAARTALQLGFPPPEPENLFEPDLNLVLGIQHLKDLLDAYSNNRVKAIAAYNAGQNAVARWEKRIVTDDPEEFIERIPYGETRLYVKLVLRNYLNYQRLYGNSR